LDHAKFHVRIIAGTRHDRYRHIEKRLMCSGLRGPGRGETSTPQDTHNSQSLGAELGGMQSLNPKFNVFLSAQPMLSRRTHR
jgi:hypothetical protein